MRREPERAAAATGSGPAVALFVTCLTDTFFPRVGEAVVRVLRALGCRVEFPEAQTCCGQPAFNSGFRDDAAALARRMIAVFEPYDHVVTPSASCAAMVRDHFPELLTDRPAWRERAERLSRRIREFTVFLRDVLHADLAALLAGTGNGLPRDSSARSEKVSFHYPCHARTVYSLPEFEGCLRKAFGAALTPPERPDLCCGFGGMFAVDFPEVSGAMLEEKLESLRATGARRVVCNEGGCGLHLAGGAHRQGMALRFIHVAELLAEAMGLMGAERDTGEPQSATGNREPEC